MRDSTAPMSAPLILACLLASFSGCGSSGAPLTPETQAYRVLFIGNSLTYTNDLPASVGQLASVAGDSFEVESVALPDLALIDHVNGQSNALQVIRSGRWNYVVLQ